MNKRFNVFGVCTRSGWLSVPRLCELSKTSTGSARDSVAIGMAVSVHVLLSKRRMRGQHGRNRVSSRTLDQERQAQRDAKYAARNAWSRRVGTLKGTNQGVQIRRVRAMIVFTVNVIEQQVRWC